MSKSRHSRYDRDYEGDHESYVDKKKKDKREERRFQRALKIKDRNTLETTDRAHVHTQKY
jgi:hypothetical protein